MACTVIVTIFESQLNLSVDKGLATMGICVFASLLISASAVNSIAFASGSNVYVGFGYVANAIVFSLFAIFAKNSVSGTDLLFFQSLAQFIAIAIVIYALTRILSNWKKHGRGRHFGISLGETASEAKTLLQYGAKQILVVSVVTFSQWFIQRKIVFGEDGPSENAIYGVGNQIFNIITFLPTILGPLIVTKLASAGKNARARQDICISSLKIFGGIALTACVLTFIGLHFGIGLLPKRYAACVETGTLASIAAAFQVLKAPFSLYFLSELRVSREIASAVLGALFMIVATMLLTHVTPNLGTGVRLAGCAVQAAFLGVLFFIEFRRRQGAY